MREVLPADDNFQRIGVGGGSSASLWVGDYCLSVASD